MKTSSHLFRPVAMTMLAALLLAACGTGGPSQGQGTGSDTARTAPTLPPALNAEFEVASVFAEFYYAHGGWQVFGAPISDLIEENGVQMQYFPAVRLDHYPENPPGSRVVLGQLGVALRFREAPTPRPLDRTLRYFERSGHTLYPDFAPLFDQLGGESFFGLPISEARPDGNLLVQVFERAAIARKLSDPPGKDVRLAALGYAAMSRENMAAGEPGNAAIRVSLPPVVAQQPFASFLENVAYGSVLGWPLYEPYGQDGQLRQIYEKGVMVANPTAPGGARLLPLGLEHRRPAPPVPPAATPGGLYFPETGHNVQNAFAVFYQAHGGRAVFGPPITEDLLEGNLLVQYFENVRIEWHFGLLELAAIQLASYGRELPPPTASRQPVTPTPTASPVPTLPTGPDSGALSMQAWVDWSILAIGSPQTVHALVKTADGRPVAGASVILSVAFTAARITLVLPDTNAPGQTQQTFSVEPAVPGEFVVYEVAATMPRHSAVYLKDSFLLWYGALPGQ
ncbi:MAG: Ig-like domain-containing protein [Chloroflexi bacterium]|nr:Ig-like domain-containing protein [Chloroflexota bacterium]